MTVDARLRAFAVRICGRTLLVRTGLVLFDVRQAGYELDAFARAGLGTVDFPEWVLELAGPDSRFLDLQYSFVGNALDMLCEEPSVDHCVGVTGFDLVLSGMSAVDRVRTWDRLHRGFWRRQRSLLFLIPKSAAALLPRPSDLRAWTSDGRVLEI